MLGRREGRLGRSSRATRLLSELVYDDGIIEIIVHQDIVMLQIGWGVGCSDRLGATVLGKVGLGEMQCIVLELLKGIIIQFVEPVV